MSTQVTPSSNGSSTAQDLFALSDEQILQIEPDAQDIEIFVGERSDPLDPLRDDLDVLARTVNPSDAPSPNRALWQHGDDGRKAVATNAHATNPNATSPNATNANTTTANATATAQRAQNPPSPSANAAISADTAAPPLWLAERMNDPQYGAEARELWQASEAARQEASAFREVFAQPEEARAAATRARLLDEIDGAYFGAPGVAPQQLSASRAQLASAMLREDPAAFREMVVAGLRALEAAGHAVPEQGSAAQLPRLAQAFRNHLPEASNAEGAHVAPPFSAATSSAASENVTATLQPQTPAAQMPATHPGAVQTNITAQQDARLAAYAAFERAANDELERGVAGAIDRSLQQALPNAARTENGAAIKDRLSSAIRQDVEKALQGDRALGEQVARILTGQRLDAAARAQVVRLIGERAQQLIPTAARRVLADWTETTLGAQSARANRGNGKSAAPPPATNRSSATTSAHSQPAAREAPRIAPPARMAARSTTAVSATTTSSTCSFGGTDFKWPRLLSGADFSLCPVASAPAISPRHYKTKTDRHQPVPGCCHSRNFPDVTAKSTQHRLKSVPLASQVSRKLHSS